MESGWVISAINDCDPVEDWCQDNKNQLSLGDKIIQIGNIKYETYIYDWGITLFEGYKAGDSIQLVIQNAQEEPHTIKWQLPPYSTSSLTSNLLRYFIMVAPFFGLSFFVLRYIQPHDTKWLLTIILLGIYAVWLTAGVNATWQIGGSSLIVRILSWFLVPLIVHVHGFVDKPYSEQQIKFVGFGYGAAVLLSGAEFFHLLPRNLFYLAILGQPISILLVLGLRLLSGRDRPNPTIRLILLMGFIVLFPVIGTIVTSNTYIAQDRFFFVLFLITMMLLPFFYIYAIYHPQLGKWEPYFHNGLGFVAFVCLYSTFFMLITFPMWSYLEDKLPFLVGIGSAVFTALTAPLFYMFFRQAMGLLTYGRFPTLRDIAPDLTAQVTNGLSNKRFMEIVMTEMKQRLQIHYFALYLQHDDIIQLEVGNSGLTRLIDLELLSDCHDHYLPLHERPVGLERFAILLPLMVQGELIGYWMLGDRGRRESLFYPEKDIEKLRHLAHEIAMLLELKRTIAEQNHLQKNLAQQDRMVALGRMTATLAHEINNPLTVVYSNLQMLQQNDQESAFLERALRNAKHIKDLMFDVLNFTRLPSDTLDPLAVNQVIRELVTRLESIVADADVIIRWNLDPKIPAIMINRIHLEQILTNLITNACEAMQTNGGDLTLITSANTEFVIIEVADTGGGLSDEAWRFLFEPFYTTKEMGTGVGLYLTKKIIDVYGGRLTAHNNEDGAVFRVSLPITPYLTERPNVWDE